MKKPLILLLALAATGCSSRAVYENIQINKRNECMKRPPSQYEECMNGMDKSYAEYQKQLEEYERQRKEELDQPPQSADPALQDP